MKEIYKDEESCPIIEYKCKRAAGNGKAYWEKIDGECPMKKVSCNATIITEEIEANSFNKLIELNDVYTQDECGGS